MAVLALAAAVCPFPGGIPRRAATALSDASEHTFGKKRPRVAPARDSSSACLTKTTRNSVVTAAAEMSSEELLQKRQASELDALRGLLKKAELVSRRGACKGGAPPTAGKKERFLASKQRAKPIEEDFKAPSVKKRKISTLVVVVDHKQTRAPRMSQEERNQLSGRLSKLCAELPLPGHIVEFLEKQFGDADSHGEIEINFDSVQDSVLFELKAQLDKFAEERKAKKFAEERKAKKVAKENKTEKVAEESKAEKVAEESKAEKVAEESKADNVAEESKDDKVAEESKDKKLAEESKDDKVVEESKGEVVKEQKEAEEYADISIGLSSTTSEAGSKASSSSTEAKKVQDAQQRAAPKAVDMHRLLYRAKLRRQLLEMERAVLPDQRIDPRDLQRLGINEYGHPSLMRQLGLVLKVDA